MTRDESQQKFVDLWLANNCTGGCAAVTSWGKTRTAIKCALQSNSPDVIVVVPTKDLKEQWLKVLKEWKVSKYDVYVVNTAAKMELSCDMLIIDEAHTTGMADWFQLSWVNAQFDKILWLSATPERKDDKHYKLFEIAPKLMAVTYKEALENGWIANYTMFNVGFKLNNTEQILYDRIAYDLEELYKDMYQFFPAKSVDIPYIRKNAFRISAEFLSTRVWDKVKLGKRYYKLISDRKTLLYNAEEKLIRTVNYVKRHPKKKVLVFSQSQKFADALQEALGDVCITIHSGLKDKQREANLKKFRDKRTKVRVISSIKALNEGIDIPELDVGICASGTSSKKDMVQMLGRIVRLNGNKEALFYNLYIEDTQDFYWLRNRQWDMDKRKIKWV